MKIALGSDMSGELPEAVDRWLRAHGHDVVRYGALSPGQDDAWPTVARAVGESVVRGETAVGVVCCWTGTGVSIAANKVAGVRAALCSDAATAGGARQWNDANVLCLSLRATSPAIAEEILAAWFAGSPTEDPSYRAMIEDVR
ncbi:MAG: RpiB/LacA/LacB family sugar-phosphate isomerase [Candidatus Eremiobacteraeota bacterium]|nr:RpiB/LacA/LacB family sugar-phosphate isomerase [Candidatus Eremiobacteraeota bacterium]MBV8375090.1 RpiB/LacA/LacB family sugar-phosphate isomerase [Candidatus Eremiobacteraeota bacterium]